MAVATRLQAFLYDNDIDYELVSHPYSERALNTAHSACIPVKSMAKAVVLRDSKGYLMAVLPSVNKLMLGWINARLNRRLRLVSEEELVKLFPDCEAGSIPAVSTPYGMTGCWEDELNAVHDIYLAAGNHRELIHIHREQFKQLHAGEPHAAISCDVSELADVYA